MIAIAAGDNVGMSNQANAIEAAALLTHSVVAV
jgi:hypothetical protein